MHKSFINLLNTDLLKKKKKRLMVINAVNVLTGILAQQVSTCGSRGQYVGMTHNLKKNHWHTQTM